MFRGDEHHVGKLQFTKPPLVKSVKFVPVEGRVTEIEVEKLGRNGFFPIEDLTLLADITMNHAEDAGNPEGFAGG